MAVAHARPWLVSILRFSHPAGTVLAQRPPVYQGRSELAQGVARTPGPQQGPSLRQLLGRSPDRADSLVLAVWVLRRPQRRIPTVNHPLVHTSSPNDARPLTEEQLQKFPEPLRGVIAMYQHPRYVGDAHDEDEWDL